MSKRASLEIAILAVVMAIVVYAIVTPQLTPNTVQASNNVAQATVVPTPATSGGIDVTGDGMVTTQPNMALATIGVEVTNGTLTEATGAANSKMTNVIAKIKSLGVADKDIQTTNYSVTPLTQQSKDGSTQLINGYRVDNQLSVKIRKLSDLGTILDAAVSAGANNIYGVSFTLDDFTPYQHQARTAAVKDAQDKAAQLAKAGGLQLGKITSISEVTTQPIPFARAAVPSFAAAGNAVPVQTGELDVSVSVTVHFAAQ